MNNQEWINELDFMFTEISKPSEAMKDDAVYTLSMGDLLKMPAVDFYQLAKIDPEIQALLN